MWFPHLVNDGAAWMHSETLSKCLCGFSVVLYTDRLQKLGLESFSLRQLLFNFIYTRTYQIITAWLKSM